VLLLWLAACRDRSSPPDSAGNAAAGPPWFEEIAQAAGITFHHESGHRPDRFLFPETVCGGAALLDVDGDGRLDIYLIQAGDLARPTEQRRGNALYRNDGDGTFTDVSAGSGADIRSYGMGASTGDYDNDGDLDLYVTNLGPNNLLRSDGGGRFTDVTNGAGVGLGGWSAGSAFVDVDLDGDLDLFVANYIHWVITAERNCYAPSGLPDYCHPNNYEAPARDTLFRNNGDGTFTDISAEAGLGAAFGNGLGVVAADFNADGQPDIFVANDGMRNQLWLNQGNARFVDGALLAGCAIDQDGQAKAGMGVDAADLDDDADIDLLVVNLHNETDSLFRNEGEYFVDATAGSGLGVVSRAFTRFGAGFADFDNDSRLDLYEANGRVRRQTPVHGSEPFAEPNVLYRGVAGSGGLATIRFAEVSPRGGTASLLTHTSRAAAFGDLDNDGAVDIVVVNRDGPAYLLRNIAPGRGHWLTFRVLNERGSDAIGARVSLALGDRTLTRLVRTAYSYCAASDPRVHFGLGTVDRVESVAVTWTDGRTERFGPFNAGAIHLLRRGLGRSE
jgi:hypothetical protein